VRRAAVLLAPLAVAVGLLARGDRAGAQAAPPAAPVPDVHRESLAALRGHLEAARRERRCAEALVHAREILATVPDDLPALRAIEECTRTPGSAERDTAVRIIESSRVLSLVPELLDLAGVKDLVPIVSEVETKRDKSVADYLMLNEIYEKLGDPERQVRALENAMAIAPQDPRPKLLLARKRLDAGDAAGARALYREYLAGARHHPAEAYLVAYVAALAYPVPAVLILVALCWLLGLVALRRSHEPLAFVYGELPARHRGRVLPVLGALATLVLALQFLRTGSALPFGLLIVMALVAAAAIALPPLVRPLRPYLRLAKRAIWSLFSERFARTLGRVPPGLRVLIALGTVFVMITVVPLVPSPDVRYTLLVLCALLFFGTIGSLIVTFLRASTSLRRSLRWIGFAATLPFLSIYLFNQWDEIGAPLFRGRWPSRHAVNDLASFLALWGVTVVFSLHLSKILADALVAPVKTMMTRVAAIEQGDFRTKIDVASRDEIGALGEAVNRMADGLARREFVERTFRTYVDRNVADRILAAGDAISPQRMKAVVMFCDMRGFTSLSERLGPEDVAAILSDYFEEMVAAIKAQGGVIDKFIGDAIMAVWGVPTEVPDAPRRAVAAALAMSAAMETINDKLASLGQPRLGIGIGINAGDVVAGPLGTRDKKEYTVIGDTVNTAQRAEANARAQQILITEPIFRALAPELEAEALEARVVKGKAEPVRFWLVHGLRAPAQPARGASAPGTPVRS
jgi:class 3 adenylate cyclase